MGKESKRGNKLLSVGAKSDNSISGSRTIAYMTAHGPVQPK